MWVPSAELMKNIVYIDDVLNEPDIYPAELVEALRELRQAATEGRNQNFFNMYSIEGYVISAGMVGVCPNAPQSVKDEWMG